MPQENQWNNLIPGLLQGLQGLSQGYMNKLYGEDAKELYGKGTQTLEAIQDQQKKRMINEQIRREALNTVGIQPRVNPQGEVNPTLELTGEMQQQPYLLEDTLPMYQQYGEILGQLQNNPFGQNYAGSLDMLYKSTQPPKVDYKFDPLGNIYKETEGQPPELYQESHRTQTLTGEEGYYTYQDDDGNTKYVKRYPIKDAQGRILPGEYDEVEVSYEEYRNKTITPEERIDLQTEAILERKQSTPVRRKKTSTRTSDTSLKKELEKGTVEENRKKVQSYTREKIIQMPENDVNTLEKSPYITKEQLGWIKQIKSGELPKEFKKEPMKPPRQFIEQKAQELELTTTDQKQALENVTGWILDTINLWGRPIDNPGITAEQWADEIEQEEWDDVEWEILKQEFKKYTGEDISKYLIR